MTSINCRACLSGRMFNIAQLATGAWMAVYNQDRGAAYLEPTDLPTYQPAAELRDASPPDMASVQVPLVPRAGNNATVRERRPLARRADGQDRECKRTLRPSAAGRSKGQPGVCSS